MLHFNGIHKNTKKPPKKGDKIWIVPIRYYDEKHNQPIEFDFDHVSGSVYVDGEPVRNSLNFYGFSHEYNHDVYIMDICDSSWYWTKESAIDAIDLLAKIKSIVSHDDFHHLFETKILPSALEERKKRKELKHAR